MALDSTWGGSVANSYVDLTMAHSFLLTFVFDATAWTDATTAQREASLAEAAISIDNFQYIGARYYSSQRLAFPRAMSGESDFYSVAGTPDSTFQLNMKDAVQRAAAYQALHVCRLGGRDTDLENQARGIESYTEEVGPVRESASYGGTNRGGIVNPAARMNSDALSLLGPYRTSKKIFRA